MGQVLGGARKSLSLPDGGEKTHDTHLHTCKLDIEFHSQNGSYRSGTQFLLFRGEKIQGLKWMNAMLNILSGRDGTRIWTFIFVTFTFISDDSVIQDHVLYFLFTLISILKVLWNEYVLLS